MPFYSVLFDSPEDRPQEDVIDPPSFFTDLNLNDVVEAIVAGKEEYNLKPFYYTHLTNANTIIYRQEVMRDLESEPVLSTIKLFADHMCVVRRYLKLKDSLYYNYHKKGWFLEAVSEYCKAVTSLSADLSNLQLISNGLLAFRSFLNTYTTSDDFKSLLAETEHLKERLASLKYSIIIKSNRVTVCDYEDQIDYSKEIERIFQKFRQGSVKDYTFKIRSTSGMNHVLANILDLVAKLNPQLFSDLDLYCSNHQTFLHPTIATFDREIQFYIAYLDYIANLRQAGLRFCYPAITNQKKEIFAYDTYDIALANKLVRKKSSIICNDFYLKENERILLISGPNQGGKTTFARTFGQLHYLATIGLPVPGSEAQLFTYDRLFTHFEKEEDIDNLRGKLQDELIRICDILRKATPNSIIVINEIFNSTTLMDALLLGKKIMEQIIQLDLLCVYVTFIDELAVLGDSIVSMMSTIVPGHPELRTFKIIRKPPDGLAYALSLADKYGLTYDRLKERIKDEGFSHVQKL